jgi:hypothetical protein
MASKRTRGGQAPPSPGADDFRQIKGVGPIHAQQLYAAGITTFAQLAALSPEETVAQLDGHAGLTAARIAEQGWAAQARALAEGLAHDQVVEGALGAVGEPKRDGADLAGPAGGEAPSGQRHASFAITLVLDNDDTVVRTQVTYARPEGGEEKGRWLRWDADQLLRFIAQHARLRPPADTVPPVVETPPVASAIRPAQTVLAPRLLSMALVPPSAGTPQQ